MHKRRVLLLAVVTSAFAGCNETATVATMSGVRVQVAAPFHAQNVSMRTETVRGIDGRERASITTFWQGAGGETGQLAVEVVGGRLRVNDADYGAVRAGDVVAVTANRVLVNGLPRQEATTPDSPE